MTVKEMNRWKAHGKLWYKQKYIKEFWKTNPTDEQERLRSIISQMALYIGFISGILLGFCFGVMN
jgi:F0F1-type ATP synthase assembly protein I